MATQPRDPIGSPGDAARDPLSEDRLARVLGRPVPRRDFLKLAAAGGASAGLAAFLAACGSSGTSSSPSAGAATSTTAPGASASISAVASPGRPIKIGFVSPKTGPLAGFGEADDFVLSNLKDTFASKIV